MSGSKAYVCVRDRQRSMLVRQQSICLRERQTEWVRACMQTADGPSSPCLLLPSPQPPAQPLSRQPCRLQHAHTGLELPEAAGKAGGFLARDWLDGGPCEQLCRRSYQLHAELAARLHDDIGFRTVTTASLSLIGERGKQYAGVCSGPRPLAGDPIRKLWWFGDRF